MFVDTSAIYATVNVLDQFHAAARRGWDSAIERRDALHTTNYVLLESTVLSAKRLGLSAVRDLQSLVAPVLQVHWVDEDMHDSAMAALLTAGRRDLSLVDCVSFELMRRLRLDTVFGFDPHFSQQGFKTFP